MNRIILPTILSFAVLVAGLFAMLPVEQASTVHTTLQDTQEKLVILTLTGVEPGTALEDTATWAIARDFKVEGIMGTTTNDAGDNCNLGVTLIRTDTMTAGLIIAPNPAIFAAAPDNNRNILDNAAAATQDITGNARLIVELVADATCAADDSVTLTVLIRTDGTVADTITGVNGSGD